MNEKYCIGDVVRRHGFSEDFWYVIATRQHQLTTDYLSSLQEKGIELKVDGLEEMTRNNGISVDHIDSDPVDSDKKRCIKSGMHYIVKKILKTTKNGFYRLDEKNVYCFENDLFQ